MTGIEFHGDTLLVDVNINWVRIVQTADEQIEPAASGQLYAFYHFRWLDGFIVRERRVCKASPSTLRLNTVIMIAKPG
jgi:hypothetical protein